MMLAFSRNGDAERTRAIASNACSTGATATFDSAPAIIRWLQGWALSNEWHGIPVTYTPEAAAACIKYLNTTNRQKRESRSLDYAKIMKAGHWRRGSIGVGFDTNFKITNGQHRLDGVVKAGIPVQLLTVFHCDPRSRGTDDTGCTRAEYDCLTLTGTKASRGSTAVVKAFLSMPFSHFGKWDIEQLREAINQYGDQLQFAESLTTIKNRSLSAHSVAQAAIARAAMYVSRDRLSAFVAVLDSRVASVDGDMAAATLGSFIDRNGYLRQGGAQSRIELYKLYQAAIRAFSQHKPLKIIRPVEEDLWPIK